MNSFKVKFNRVKRYEVWVLRETILKKQNIMYNLQKIIINPTENRKKYCLHRTHMISIIKSSNELKNNKCY